MARSIIRFAVPLVGGALVSLASFACSSDESKGSGNGGTDGGSGGSTSGTGGSTSGTGGSTSGTGGSTSGTGGTTSAADGGNFTCVPKAPPPDPGGTVAAGGDCCDGAGTCKAPGDLTGDLSAANYGHDDCTSTLSCAPKPVSSILDSGTLPTCHAPYGSLTLEGRCLPKCFVINNKNYDQLTIADCPTNSGFDVICAPCFDPTTGDATGACSRDGDSPATTAQTFVECGRFGPDGGAGSEPMGFCVPTSLIQSTGADITLIPQDTCATGELCAPKNKVIDPRKCFDHCVSPLGGDAVCVATYLVESTTAGMGLSGVLGQVTCAVGETCAPCVSPLDQSVTGACAN